MLIVYNTMSDNEEDGFESLVFPPPNQYLSPGLKIQKPEKEFLPSARTDPIRKEEFEKFIDPDGRLINEHSFRQAVFKGGVDHSIRKDVWKLLFGYFHCHSTHRERQVLTSELNAKYEALKERWQKELMQYPDEVVRTLVSCNASDISPPELKPNISCDQEINQAQSQFLNMQSQVFAKRQQLSAKFIDSIRSIDKDVPRTNRSHTLFKHDDSPYFHMLRNILITFAAFHENVGYAQGMNDIASRFLIIMENEAEAYWCFTNFVEQIQVDFLEEGMIKKLDLLRGLLREIDVDLYYYLDQCQVCDLAFCHRWLLLSFLREFEFNEGLRIFEILSSHYLEMNSLEAEKTRELSRQIQAEQGGENYEYNIPTDSQLTFVLFVCVAILMMNRDYLFACSDVVSVFQCVNSLTKTLSVDEVMIKAEMLFYAYCKKSVVESFHVIESPAPKK